MSPDSTDGEPLHDQPLVDAILALVRARTSTDFTRYRTTTIRRRITNRMISVGAHSLAQYLELLQSSETEVIRLIERLTITVSSFYRDPNAFAVVRNEVLPQLAARRAGVPLRIWSAGCGCGEEAYTLAMLLEERGVPGTVHASDIDRAALQTAAAAVYPAEAVAELPPALASTYLAPCNGGYGVVDAVRARVKLIVHDVMSEALPDAAPFDLISCRNVLIYLQAPDQLATLQHLQRALVPQGFLFLGEAEWLGRLEPEFRRHPSGLRVFQAIA